MFNSNLRPFNCIFAIIKIFNILTFKKMKHKIIIINGPNLNLLGEREKEKYGNITLNKLKKNVKILQKKKYSITFKQSNIEGKIIDYIQESRKKFDGLIINAAGILIHL